MSTGTSRRMLAAMAAHSGAATLSYCPDLQWTSDLQRETSAGKPRANLCRTFSSVRKPTHTPQG